MGQIFIFTDEVDHFDLRILPPSLPIGYQQQLAVVRL